MEMELNGIYSYNEKGIRDIHAEILIKMQSLLIGLSQSFSLLSVQ